MKNATFFTTKLDRKNNKVARGDGDTELIF